MKLKFKTQAYQTAAVQAVVDCFAGQPPASDDAMRYRIDPGSGQGTTDDMFADGFRNADLKLTEPNVRYDVVDSFDKLMSLVQQPG